MVRPRNPNGNASGNSAHNPWLDLEGLDDLTPGQKRGQKQGKGQARDSTAAPARGCEHPDCTAAGDYPAPRSRHQLRQYRWFCLEHIKSYNTKWNYFDGLGDELLEEHRKADMTWRRPTWRPGQSFRGWHDSERQLLDEIGLTEFAPQFFQAHADGRAGQTAGSGAGKSSGQASGQGRAAADAATMARLQGMTPPRHLRSALALFNLPYPFSAQQLKQRYRQLVKQYHPDVVAAAGGEATVPVSTNTSANSAKPTAPDDAMKNINDAHQRLKNHLQGGDG